MTDDAERHYDPRGLIRESYRIEGITAADCRSIFLDWALGLKPGQTAPVAAEALLAHHRPDPGHPMTALLQEARSRPATARRKGGAKARQRTQ